MLNLYRMNAVRTCNLLRGKFPLSNHLTDFYMMGRLALNRLGRIDAAAIQISYYTLPSCF